MRKPWRSPGAAYGRDHPAVARQEVGLARIELDRGRPAAARALLLHALAVQQRSLRRPGDRRLGVTQGLLGTAGARLSRFAEAEPCLLARTSSSRRGPRPRRTRKARGRANLSGSSRSTKPGAGPGKRRHFVR